MGARITMRDVAEAVGVSPMTVSRAFREDRAVSVETRNRIRQAADRLGYVYDSSATAFRTQKSGFVAVTLPSLNNANFAETYRGLSNAIEGSGMQLLLGATNYRVEKEEDLVRQLLARNPEALVMTGGHHTEATRDLVAARGIPVIEMWDLPDAPLGHAVGFSNADAMGRVVGHLATKGCRQLAFVGTTDGTDSRGSERLRGARITAERLGLPVIRCLDAGPAPVSMRHGAELVERLAGELAAYDALICVSDPVAFGVLSACRRLGMAVPGDIALTGFGAFEVSAVSDPRITTVSVEARRIGEEVARLLDALFAGEAVPQQVEVETKLVPGETT